MKLGLVIKITNNGEAEYPLSFNKDGQWEKFAADARSSIKELENFDETSNEVLLVKFLATKGYIIGIVKARPEQSGRPFDNVAAWIHFPSHIFIPAKETCEIVKNVIKAISGRTETDETLLKEIFDKEYDSNDLLYPAEDFIASAQDKSFGAIYYGSNSEYQLHELLGENIAQERYISYKGIFLISDSSSISLKGNNGIKINPKPACIISAPRVIDGFVPYIVGKPFDKNISVMNGMEVPIVWKRNGFADIEKRFIVDEKYNESMLTIIPKEYQFIIDRNWFSIFDENMVPINDGRISINGKELNDKIAIQQDSLISGIRILVSKNGYSSFQNDSYKMIESNKIKTKHKITLIRNIHHYEFTFDRSCLKNTESLKSARLVVETHKKLNASPLYGFSSDKSVYEGNDNDLFHDNWKIKLKFFFYGVAACFGFLLFYAAYDAIDKYDFRWGWPPFVENVSPVTNEDTNDNSSAEDSSIDTINNDSIVSSYLEKNETWKKDSLEKYDTSRGLFDALNEFDKDKIQDYCNKIIQSEKLRQILDELNTCGEWDPKTKNSNGKYNSDDEDKMISRTNYIDYLLNKEAKKSDTYDDKSDNKKGSQTKQKKVESKTSHITGKTSEESSKQSKSIGKEQSSNNSSQSNAGNKRGGEK